MLRLFLLCICLLANLTSAEAKRVALVIGNNIYPNLPEFRQLQKAVNDARTMRETLERDLGFTVSFGENVDWRKMKALTAQFEASVADGDVAFIYFSGHGVSIGAKNYLLPSDIPLPIQGEEDRLIGNSFGADALTRKIQKKVPASSLPCWMLAVTTPLKLKAAKPLVAKGVCKKWKRQKACLCCLRQALAKRPWIA